MVQIPIKDIASDDIAMSSGFIIVLSRNGAENDGRLCHAWLHHKKVKQALSSDTLSRSVALP